MLDGTFRKENYEDITFKACKEREKKICQKEKITSDKFFSLKNLRDRAGERRRT